MSSASLVLIKISDGKTEFEQELEEGIHELGRSRSNKIKINDPMSSGRHLKIEVKANDQVIYIEDLGSTNGTSFEGKPFKNGKLKVGNFVTIGNTNIIYSKRIKEDTAQTKVDPIQEVQRREKELDKLKSNDPDNEELYTFLSDKETHAEESLLDNKPSEEEVEKKQSLQERMKKKAEQHKRNTYDPALKLNENETEFELTKTTGLTKLIKLDKGFNKKSKPSKPLKPTNQAKEEKEKKSGLKDKLKKIFGD